MEKQKYVVFVDYQTNSGNPATKRKVVSAWTVQEATEKAVSQVKHLKTCMKVNGANATPASAESGEPQPNWQQELDRLSLLREKAIAHLEKANPHGRVGVYDDIEIELLIPLVIESEKAIAEGTVNNG